MLMDLNDITLCVATVGVFATEIMVLSGLKNLVYNY
jgi:hypothetical protein